MTRSGPRLLAVAIVVLGAVLRFWALDTGLPHPMTRPDEEQVLGYTNVVAHGQWDVGWTVYPAPFIWLTTLWGQAGLELGARAGRYDTADYVTNYKLHPERLIFADRVLAALLGTASVAIAIGLGRMAMGWPAGLLAGLLLATSFLHARDSHFMKPDVHLAFGILLALWPIARLAAGASCGRAVLAGLAIGGAVGAKHPAVLLAAPAYVAAVWGSPRRDWRRFLPGAVVTTGVVALLTVVAMWPYLLVSPETRAAFVDIARLVLPQLGQPAASTPSLATLAAQGGGWHWWYGFVKHSTFSLPYGAGWAATLLAPLAVAWGLASRRVVPVICAVFVLVWFGVHGMAVAFHARYMTPLLPPLAVLEGCALAAFATWAGGARAGLLAAALGVAVAAEPFAATVAHDRIAARTDTRNLAAEWVQTHLPPRTRIGVVGTLFWAWSAPRFGPAYPTFTLPPDAAAFEAKQVQYVVTNDHVLFSSHVDWDKMTPIMPRLTLLQAWSPFAPGGRERAIFEDADAYYIPFHHFDGVVRPGPDLRLYAFK